ncbi:MAG: response regulator [Reichenbachiella sp.]
MLDRGYKENIEKKYTILYVDDEEVNLRVFNRNFNKYYEVYTAIDGEEAQEILASHHIDLIMTDQMMPGMNGSELLLKIVPKYPSIIRMIMTGFSDVDDIAEVIKKIGLHKFLKKPWDTHRLKQTFDDALEDREGKISEKAAAVKNEVREKPSISVNDNESLDLLESTMSLVESKESQQLKKDLTSLVSESKRKKSEFMDGGLNYLLNLKDALLPIQGELKLYVEDAFIVYDKKTVNQNGYWFGERDELLVVVSYFSNSHARESLTFNSFVSAALTEIVYKERCSKPDEILKMLSTQVKFRFVENGKETSCPLEISVVVINEGKDELTYSGAYHDIYYLDDKGGFIECKGNAEALVPGNNIKFKSHGVELSSIKAMYVVPFNVIEETNENKENSSALKMLLNEVGKMPFGMQSKMFEEYGYRSVIGLKF